MDEKKKNSARLLEGSFGKMGLFFEDRPKVKSKKAVIVLKCLIYIGLIVVVVRTLFMGFSFKNFSVVFLLFGFVSVIDGVEGYLHKQKRKYYLFDLVLALMYFLIYIQYQAFN